MGAENSRNQVTPLISLGISIRLVGEKNEFWGDTFFQMAVNVLPPGGHNHCLVLVKLKRKELVGEVGTR